MLKLCTVTKKCFLKVDMFGVSTQMKLFNKDEYQTFYGAVLSLILISLLSWKTITLGFEMLTKKEFSFQLYDLPDIDCPLQMNDFILALCPMNQVNYSSWFFGNFTNMDQPQIAQISPYHCPLSRLFQGKKDSFPNCFCFDLQSHKLTDSNDVSLISLSLAFILNEPQIDPITKSQVLFDFSSDIALFYSYSYVETRDYYHPVKTKHQMHHIQNVTGKNVFIEFNVENIEIIKENDFKIEGYEEQNLNKNFSKISSVNIQSINTNTVNGMISIKFYHSGWMKRYVFNGFDSDEFFSVLGGFYEIWIWIFTLIGNFVNRIAMKYYIKGKLISKEEKEILSKLSFMKEKESPMIDHSNLQQSDGLANDSPVKQSHPSLTIGKGGESIKVLSCNDLSVESIQMKTSTIRRANNISKKYDAVQQFHKHMDYETIYRLILEVKLLELLCLDQKKAYLFHNCINAEYDLEMLQEQLKNTSLCKGEEDTEIKCYQRNIDIIMKCMIHRTENQEIPPSNNKHKSLCDYIKESCLNCKKLKPTNLS